MNYFKSFVSISLLLLVSVLFFACDKTDESEYTPVYTVEGNWARFVQLEDTVFWAEARFEKSGTYNYVILDSIPGHGNTQGTYTYADNKLTINNEDCTGPGVYKVEFAQFLVTLTHEADNCAPRVKSLDGTWSTVNSTPFVFGSWKRLIVTNDTSFYGTLSLNQDFTFSFIVQGTVPGHTNTGGSYTVVNNRITLSDQDCLGNGAYFFTMSDQYHLMLKTDTEPCPEREVIIQGDWGRVGY